MNATSLFRLKIAGIIVALIFLLVLPPFLATYWLGILMQMLIFGILAMSLDVLMGYTGLASFGHCAYFGTSAYMVAILSTRYHVGALGCILAAILAAIVRRFVRFINVPYGRPPISHDHAGTWHDRFRLSLPVGHYDRRG